MNVLIAISFLTAALLAEKVEGRIGGTRQKLSQSHVTSLQIPDEYIIILSSGAAGDQVEAQATKDMDSVIEQCKKDNAIVTSKYHSVIMGLSVSNLTSSALKQLLNNDSVEYIEENQKISQHSSVQKPAPWNLDRIDEHDWPLDGEYRFPESDGTGIDVYVMDSGIRASHEEFGGRASCGLDVVEEDGRNDCFDGSGHGTHVAGTIGGVTYGVAKNANIVAVKVINRFGGGTLSNVLKGVDYVVSQTKKSGKAILNMSLGGPNLRSLNDAIDSAYKVGLLTVASAGNQNTDACTISPASAQSSISVGALQKGADKLSSYTNYGSCVDIFAPADGIESAGNSGDSSSSTKTGTSMAGPLVAGVAALFMEKYPNANVETVRNYVLTSGILEDKIDGDLKGSPNRLISTIGITRTQRPTSNPTSPPTDSPTKKLTPKPTSDPGSVGGSKGGANEDCCLCDDCKDPVDPTLAIEPGRISCGLLAAIMPRWYGRGLISSATCKMCQSRYSSVCCPAKNAIQPTTAPTPHPTNIPTAMPSFPECCLCNNCADPKWPRLRIAPRSRITCQALSKHMPLWYDRKVMGINMCQKYQSRYSPVCCG